MSFIQELADKLARDVLDAQEELGDISFFEKVSKVLGAASPTMQEAFMTSVRIRLAEVRGRDFLNVTLAAFREANGTAKPVQDAQEAAKESKPSSAPPAKQKSAISAAAKARMIADDIFGPGSGDK